MIGSGPLEEGHAGGGSTMEEYDPNYIEELGDDLPGAVSHPTS